MAGRDDSKSKLVIALRTFFVAFIVLFSPLNRVILAQSTSFNSSPNGNGASVSAEDFYQVQRLSRPIEIDGLVDEASWATVPALPMVTQWPTFGESPSEQTEIKIAYDDSYLYVSCRCFDDPDGIQGPTFKRDVWNMTMDQLMIGLDTFNDNENMLVFVVTPSGSRIDLQVFDDSQRSSKAWNSFWDAASHSFHWGWSSEMRIPFSSLRFQETDGRVEMGVIAWRYIARKNELDVFPAIPPDWGFNSALKPSQSQRIVFEDVSSSNPLYIMPYALSGLGQDFNLNEAGDAYEREDNPTYDLGLDLKYGLTDNLTLDLTANTDFAQVEADNQQVNLTRFSLFFPERRLFFQERSSNFEFGFGDSNRLFYTRRIGLRDGQQVRLLGGARLVGRAGAWDVGLMNMQAARQADIASENFGVVRLRRQVFNPYSYLGGITTTRLAEDGTYNVAYGLDGIIKLFGDDFLAVNWAQTFDSEANSPLASLDPVRMRLLWERRTYAGLGYRFDYSRAGRSYEPGLGFEFRDDFTSVGTRLFYGTSPGDTSPFIRNQVFVEQEAFFRNVDGTLETLTIGPGIDLNWKGGSTFMAMLLGTIEDLRAPFSFSEDAEVPADRYTFYQVTAQYGTSAVRLLQSVNTFSLGSFYDGWLLSVGFRPFWNISRYLSVDGFYQFNNASFPERKQRWMTHVARIRIEAALNTRISFSSFIQYNSASEALIGNLRFRYNPREGNDFYIVYNEGINTNRFSVNPVLPFTSSRTVLLKYTYTFLF